MRCLTILNEVIWQWVLPVLLTVTALLYLVRLRGRPLRGLGGILRGTYGSLLRRDKRQHGIFAAALAATMGTGNLVGTALALMTGGAGAVFWMWVSALLGMVLVYAENLLGARFRCGSIGGAFAYLRYGTGKRLPAVIFAVCCTGAALGMGNIVQSSAIAQTARCYGISAPLCGLMTALLLGVILIGGSERVRGAAGLLMPLLCGCYLLGCVRLLICHAEMLPSAFLRIFREAFGFRAVGGGVSAAVLMRSMRVGLQRGIFSNEAGLGSSSLLHLDGTGGETAQSKWAVAEVFADTILCCTATALVILTAPECDIANAADASSLLLTAFSSGLGRLAGGFLAVCMILLAFATMVGWFPCGAAAVRYLTNGRGEHIYLAAYLLTAFAGALSSPEWLWALCDCCNGCMALPNLWGMLYLLPSINEKCQASTKKSAPCGAD